MTEINELLRSEDYWQEPAFDSSPETGDLFEELPLLSQEAGPITAEDEWGRTRLYLAATMGLGLLVAVLPRIWWVAPVVTAENFAQQEVFEEMIRRAVSQEGPTGWLALPPLSGSRLSEMALAALLRPTVLDPSQFEDLGLRRVATLTEDGRRLLARQLSAVVRAIE